MDTRNADEIAYRRRAIRLTLKGKRPSEILKQIPRTRQWLHKWQHRFEHGGWAGLASHGRRPHHSPHAYHRPARAVIVQMRRRLARSCVGLVGARAVQQEIRRGRLLRPVPSLGTINRWLKEAGLIEHAPPAPEKVYYPAPCVGPGGVVQARDWIARYLEGGEKVFVFHTVDAHTRALQQTLKPDKTVASLLGHVGEVWQRLGVPDFLQLDNDSAFTGGQRTPRRVGVFVRLALYLGIELIFTPPAEPKRNGLVEGLNGLWASKCWARHHFRSLQEVRRKSQQFTDWYAHHSCPPALDGLTPAQAHRRVPSRRLTPAQVRSLPAQLPVPAGRLHFIRRVSATGEIGFLGETWKVSKRLAHQYVWATVSTHAQRLEIYHRCSERGAARLVTTYAYAIAEGVRRVPPEYRRRRGYRRVLQILGG
jgi:putative transposase